MRAAALALVLAASLGGGPCARSAGASCPAPGSPWSSDNPPCYPWQGRFQSRPVSIPSHRKGPPLLGTEFAPLHLSGRLAAVAVLHGLGGRQQNVWWIARDLAGHGYITLTVDARGNKSDDFLDAMQSMIDYLASGKSPFGRWIDTSRIGAAGHSAGARAASWVQGADRRVRAIVALDNLVSDVGGDEGSALLGATCRPIFAPVHEPIRPLVPALGMASDMTTNPLCNGPDIKKTAWTKWRAARVAALEIVLRGSNHLSFDQDATRLVTGQAYLRVIAYYTQGWFDAFLKRAPSGLGAVLAQRVLGRPRDDYLSAHFHSAAFIPEARVDCPQFTIALCPAAR